MSVTFNRLPRVRDRTGWSRSEIYRRVGLGLLPPPIPLGPRCSVWVESEIDEVLRAIVAGANQDQLRSLVSELVSRRASARTEPNTSRAA